MPSKVANVLWMWPVNFEQRFDAEERLSYLGELAALASKSKLFALRNFAEKIVPEDIIASHRRPSLFHFGFASRLLKSKPAAINQDGRAARNTCSRNNKAFIMVEAHVKLVQILEPAPSRTIE